MANVDSPNGLKAVSTLSGGNIRLQYVTFSSTNSAIGYGSPLTLLADGTYDAWSNGLSFDGVSGFQLAANTGGTGPAYVDPNIIYSVQTDNGAGTLTAQTAIGLNANLIAGSVSSFGASTAELDESSGAAGAGSDSLPVHVIGLDTTYGNEFGEFNRLLVVTNTSRLKAGVVGI